MKPRKITDADARTLRQNYELRKNAAEMRAVATRILQTVPSVRAQALRLGIQHRHAGRIAAGQLYKDVG